MEKTHVYAGTRRPSNGELIEVALWVLLARGPRPAGQITRQIAEAVGVSSTAVRQWAARLGIRKTGGSSASRWHWPERVRLNPFEREMVEAVDRDGLVPVLARVVHIQDLGMLAEASGMTLTEIPDPRVPHPFSDEPFQEPILTPAEERALHQDLSMKRLIRQGNYETRKRVNGRWQNAFVMDDLDRPSGRRPNHSKTLR